MSSLAFAGEIVHTYHSIADLIILSRSGLFVFGGLLVPEGLDRVLEGGFARWIHAEEDPDRGGKREGHDDGPCGDARGQDVDEQRDEECQAHTDQYPDDAARAGKDPGLDLEAGMRFNIDRNCNPDSAKSDLGGDRWTPPCVS